MLRTWWPPEDLHDQGIEVDDRVDRLQRPGLPGLDLLEDRVGDVGNGVRRQVGAQRARQMMLDVADRHPAGIQADDLIIQAAEATLALGHQPWGEGASPVPRHLKTQRPDLALHRLRRAAVTAVARPAARRITLLITHMAGQLRRQPLLQHRLDHLREEAARAGQRDPAFIRPVDQLIQPRIVGKQLPQLPARHPARRTRIPTAGRALCHDVHAVLPSKA